MPEIPAGAKVPQDHQSAEIKPEEHPDGWDLLRPPMDVEEWESAELIAILTQIRTRGETVTLTGNVIRQIGQIAKILQQEISVDSTSFRAWLKTTPEMTDRYTKILTLAMSYMVALGEASSSEN